MQNSTPEIDLESLRTTLERLRSQPLPEEVQEVSELALESLDEFSHTLQASREQSRLAALYQVSQSMGTSLDLEEVLNQVMDAVIELTGAERGFLMLLDADTGHLDLRAARNFERETLERKDMEVSRTVIQTTVESGESVATINAQTDPRFSGQESVIAYALRSILCAPLRSRGKVIGVIYVDNRIHSGVFTEADLDLLKAFATQAAVAIENAQLYTRTDQNLAARVGELETLSQIDRQLNASLEFKHVLAVTSRWASEGTGAQLAWIALSGEENPTLAVAAGPDQGRTLERDDPLIAQVLNAGRPQALAPSELDPAYAVAPLLQADRPIGVIVAEREEPFGAADLDFLTRLAARAATAIQNARLYHAVQEANQAKSKFVSVVSHELRIPMTSIKGYTDLLLKGMSGPVTEGQVDFLNIIHNNVERMAALVNDLSDVSRIETGRLKLEPTHFPLHGVVEETLKSLRARVDEKKQTIEVHVPQDLPRIHADPNRVVQVLTNLVSNAWKYTPEGGWITVLARPEGSLVRLEVRDTGIGIGIEDQEKLFTQFFRSEDPLVREQQGWGLGLNVTKRLVELMGGEIGLTSQAGKGSTFWFTLPTQIPQTPEAQA
jgi:signal transduction histidine kinase